MTRAEGFGSLAELVESSPLIVEGQVTGEAPGGPKNDPIVPIVTFRVDATHVGNAPSKTITIRYSDLDGYPRLEVGGTYLLFLKDFYLDETTKESTGEFAVAGGWAGMYAVGGSGADRIFDRLDDDSPGLPETLDPATLDRAIDPPR